MRDVLVSSSESLGAMHHRGPDHEGSWSDQCTALAHARLRIIDTADAANQPMTDESGRYVIVFNGEIFNFKEIRKWLTEAGVGFKTESDTEVLLHLLITKGKSALHWLNGFFALSFYDSLEHKMLLARDRFGVKPLYYSEGKDRFVFASEVRALKKYRPATTLNRTALSEFFTLTYVTSPRSIFADYRSLEPGCMVELNTTGSSHSRWYEPKITRSELDFDDAAAKLSTLLDDAVKIRLVSDVPIGSFLSGGIDSSVIASLACRYQPNLPTFSIGFPEEPYYDETPYAREVSRHIGSQHHVIELRAREFCDQLRWVLDSMDEPFGDSSAVPYHALSNYTRKFVTVALSGDGADELFAGYNKHEAFFRSSRNSGMNRLLSLLDPLLAGFSGGRSSRWDDTTRQLHKYVSGSRMPLDRRYWAWAIFSDEAMVNRMIPTAAGKAFEAYESSVAPLLNDTLNGVLLADQKMVLPNDMLVKSDRMSMASSLEVRTPFLDYRVVEFANSLPVSHKISAHGRKLVLKKAFEDELPKQVFRRRKQGFEIPLQKWLKEELRDLLEDAFDPGNLKQCDLFDIATCNNLKEVFLSGKRNDLASLVWCVIVFQNWWKKNQA